MYLVATHEVSNLHSVTIGKNLCVSRPVNEGPIKPVYNTVTKFVENVRKYFIHAVILNLSTIQNFKNQLHKNFQFVFIFQFLEFFQSVIHIGDCFSVVTIRP